MENDIQTVGAASLCAAVTLRDLSDPEQGDHAMQQIVSAVVERLRSAWGCAVVVHRSSPLTTVADNYDHLHYPRDGAARGVRYTRYVSNGLLLRTQTSAMIPSLLRTLSGSSVRDVLLVCPGLVYRRDSIDRLHAGECHQLDLWRIRDGHSTVDDLEEMMRHVVEACVPEADEWRATPTAHPYTTDGRQLDVRASDAWVEIGECGRALPAVLGEAGLGTNVSGLALGVGLDRLLMLRKGIPDIRLLRSSEPRVAQQMMDLAAYRAISRQPAIRRDLSLSVDVETTVEDLGAQVRDLLGPEHRSIEEVAVLAETQQRALSPEAVERMGMSAGQKNVLVRLTIRDLERSLTSAEANVLRDRVYRELHRGTKLELSPAAKT